jgi:DNA-directed RNA polymerase subunit L
MRYITKINKINDSEIQIMFNKGTPYYVLNMYRCFLLSHIPTFALTKQKVNMNTTVYSDEIIQQRISLIPIHVPDKYNGLENKIIFKIDKKNEQKKNIDITTNDFIITLNDNNNTCIINPEEFFETKSYEDPIPIVTLYNSERDVHEPSLQLEVTLEQDVGATHICHSPVSIVSIYDDVLNVEFTHTKNIDISIKNAKNAIKNQILNISEEIFKSNNINIAGENKFYVNIDINKYPIIHTLSIYIQKNLNKKFTFVAFEKNHPLKSNTKMKFSHNYKSNILALDEIKKILRKLETKI